MKGKLMYHRNFLIKIIRTFWNFKKQEFLPFLTKNDFFRFSIKAVTGIFNNLFSVVNFFLFFIKIINVFLSLLKEYLLLNDVYNNYQI